MHDHKECNHNLKYCPKCDVVYCTSCQREWYGHKHDWYVTYPSYPYTITYKSDVTTDVVTTCSHE